MMPLTVYSQKYQIEKSKLDKLLQVYFYTLPACDSTVNAYQIALQKSDSVIHSGNQLIILRTQERNLKVLESETWEKRFNNQERLYIIESKKTLKKGRRQGLLLGGGIGLILLVLAL